MRKPFTRLNSAGFTLTELLVVVAIISVLIAILVPALQRARQQAYTVQCQSNLRQIGMAFFNYATENRDYMPPVGYAASNWTDGLRGATFYHILGKAGYLGSKERFRGAFFNIDQTRFAVTRCPAEQPRRVLHRYYDSELMAGSYVMNWSITWYHYYLGYQGPDLAYKCYRKGFTKGPTYKAAPTYKPIPAHQARLVIDTTDWGAGWTLPFFNYHLDGPITNWLYSGENLYAFRHPNQTLNALYMDGHVEPHQHISKTGKALYQVLYPDP